MTRKPIQMAIAYDFDGTLANGNMQEHQFLPKIKMTPKAFWNKVNETAKDNNADPVLIYMYLMLEKARENGAPVRRTDFMEHGKKIKFFEGVEDWFDRITEYGKNYKIDIQHYLISSGNDEIFAGTSIVSKFKKVFASKFFYDVNGVAVWPALDVNYTTKTQFLFRINKDALDLSDNRKINKFVSKTERPIPFENMI